MPVVLLSLGLEGGRLGLRSEKLWWDTDCIGLYGPLAFIWKEVGSHGRALSRGVT